MPSTSSIGGASVALTAIAALNRVACAIGRETSAPRAACVSNLCVADAAAIPALLEAVHDVEKDGPSFVVGAPAERAASTPPPANAEVLPALIEALDDEYDQVPYQLPLRVSAMTRDPRGIAALVRACGDQSTQDQVRGVFQNRVEGNRPPCRSRLTCRNFKPGFAHALPSHSIS